eukprot:356868-Chlamydomonas_euryale.AAC.22
MVLARPTLSQGWCGRRQCQSRQDVGLQLASAAPKEQVARVETCSAAHRASRASVVGGRCPELQHRQAVGNRNHVGMSGCQDTDAWAVAPTMRTHMSLRLCSMASRSKAHTKA